MQCYTDSEIDGVMALSGLKGGTSDTGYSYELIQFKDTLGPVEQAFFKEGIAQISHALMLGGRRKDGWHMHHNNVDWFYLITGKIILMLFDGRRYSPSYFVFKEVQITPGMGGPIIKVPPGVWHTYTAEKESNIIYMFSQRYDDLINESEYKDLTAFYKWTGVIPIKEGENDS